ncbi:MAG: response regulator, partial [Gammaproteobacteria bacterium]|nr:response regulator [Gammaproteobacteria bacterium]
MNKTALIVDDSRSARVVLKRVLETHDLDVDTSESAEEALDYLIDNRPDVIFMDHLMPGMDGFEAVSAIKRNPETATIPIMMYTSKKGEVYVGQARALGAVGVLPKEVAPVEVSKVLKSLHIIGDEKQEQSGEQAPASNETSGEFAALEAADQNLRILIQDLFEQQRAIIHRDILDSYEA